MWDDPKRLQAIAAGLALIAVGALCLGVLAWLSRQAAFQFREVVVTKPLGHANAAQLEAVIRQELAGTFFTMNIDRARAVLAQVPWVRGVALRRQWPRRLEVTVEEHVPLARWNDNGLVNVDGEVFIADYLGDLPQFVGPDGRAAEVTQRYREWAAALAALSMPLREVRLSPRGGWHLRAADAAGLLDIELGREDPGERLARFAAVYGRTVGALARAGTRIEHVDLRYHNGFAARVPGFRERPTKKGSL